MLGERNPNGFCEDSTNCGFRVGLRRHVGFPKIRGALFWGPYKKKESYYLGYYIPIFGDSHVDPHDKHHSSESQSSSAICNAISCLTCQETPEPQQQQQQQERVLRAHFCL